MSDVKIYDIGGTAETFSNFQDLNQRLIDLGYPPYGVDGGGGEGNVLSVNGQVGTVVLDADNIDDTSTTNKFATEAELNQINENTTDIGLAILETIEVASDLVDHENDILNPHEVTKTQVGLGNVSNIAPSDMPISDATVLALENSLKNIQLVDLTNGGSLIVPTSGNVTTIQEVADFLNTQTFTVNKQKLLILRVIITETINSVDYLSYSHYKFLKNDNQGDWGTGTVLGAIDSSDLVLDSKEMITQYNASNTITIDLGDILTDDIVTYLNSNTQPATGQNWELLDGNSYFFTYTSNGSAITDFYKGIKPVVLGDTGDYTVVSTDFQRISTDGVLQTNIDADTLGGYTPLGFVRATGSVSQNIDGEKNLVNNTGFGVASPSERIDVAGVVKSYGKLIKNSDSSGNNYYKKEVSISVGGWVRKLLGFSNTGSITDDFDIGIFGSSSSYVYSYMGFGSYNSTNVVRITPSGLFGFGKTPTEKVDVDGSIKATAFIGDGSQLTNLPSVDSRPYTVYTALLSQTGTNAPVATVLENTLGIVVTWTRVNVGVYGFFLPSPVLSLDRTSITLDHGGVARQVRLDASQGGLTAGDVKTYNSLGTAQDGNLFKSVFEIRVYP